MVARSLIFACVFGLSACVTSGGSFCDVAKPKRLSGASVDALSDEEVAAILAHNTKGQKLCGWKP